MRCERVFPFYAKQFLGGWFPPEIAKAFEGLDRLAQTPEPAVLPFNYGVPLVWSRRLDSAIVMEVNGIDQNAVRTQSMPQLPEPTSPLLPVSPVRPSAPIPGPVAVVPPETRAAGPAAAVQPDQRIPRWLERAELFIRVLLRMWIGIIVCFLPWWPMVWDENPLFTQHPALGSIAANGVVRGLVSGLGLLNLWIAFRDAMGKGREGEQGK